MCVGTVDFLTPQVRRVHIGLLRSVRPTFPLFLCVSYHRVLPKSSGPYEQRLQLYEAFHHLNHALMFGGSYKSSALRLLNEVADWADGQPPRGSSAT